MRLLYITNGINGSGGLERVLSVKASYLAEYYNYDVYILVLNGTDQNRFYAFSPKIQFHSVAVKGNPIQYVKDYKDGIQKIVQEIEPDVISVCDDGLKAFFIPQFLKTKAKIIYERHVSKLIEAKNTDGFVKTAVTTVKWQLMEKLARNFSKFVVLTQGNKKEWTSLRNIEVIANPLSFYPSQSSDLNSKIVICVGKIAYQKGQDILVRAWEKVHQHHPDWQLHLYGKENLKFLNTNSLDHNIHFFPPTKDIMDKYLESAVYVMSSRFEGFGMVLIEAMACGVPCVSFNCDYGPSDIITDGEDGYIVKKENEQELAEKLSILIKDENKRIRFGKKAKENVRPYNVENIVAQWDQLFKKLIK